MKESEIERMEIELPTECAYCKKPAPTSEWTRMISTQGFAGNLIPGTIAKHKCSGCGNQQYTGLLNKKGNGPCRQ